MILDQSCTRSVVAGQRIGSNKIEGQDAKSRRTKGLLAWPPGCTNGGWRDSWPTRGTRPACRADRRTGWSAES